MTSLFSCKDNEKQERIDNIYLEIKSYNASKNEVQNYLDTWSSEDLDKINPTISAFTGHTVTYRQNFHLMINGYDEMISNLYVEIERIKNE